MKIAALFLTLLTLVWGQTTDVRPCIYQAQGDSLPINTYVEGCTTPPCAFPQESDVIVNLVFRARRTIVSMQTQAYAYLLGSLSIPYDLEEYAITCNFFTNTYCPLLENEVVQYTLRMRIESWMPAGTATTVEFVIRDNADNSVVTCLRMPITITRPIQTLDTPSKNITLAIDTTA